MRYEVPQFIEIEDKVVGPLSWRQFVYLAGGVGGAVGLWILLPNIIAIPLAVCLVVLGGMLSFYEYNKQPFIVLLESWFNYLLRNKLYIWKKRERTVAQEPSIEQQAEEIINPTPYVPKLSDSKLKDLSWALDIEHRERGEVL